LRFPEYADEARKKAGAMPPAGIVQKLFRQNKAHPNAAYMANLARSSPVAPAWFLMKALAASVARGTQRISRTGSVA